MTETPLTMSIDMSVVVAATDCPHYINRWEAGSGATTCAWCTLRPIRTYGRPGQSGPNTGTVRQARPGPRRTTVNRRIASAVSEEEAA